MIYIYYFFRTLTRKSRGREVGEGGEEGGRDMIVDDNCEETCKGRRELDGRRVVLVVGKAAAT